MIQAIGGGGAVPVSLAIAAGLVPSSQRGLALGVVAGAAEAGSMLGPAYGGAVVELWGWRAIFWLNIPQAAAIAAALLFLPDRRYEGARMDYFGGALLTITLILLCLAVAHDGLFELSSWTPWWLLAGCSLGIVALVVVHRNAEQPLLSPILLRARAFLLANLVQLLVGVALILAMASIVIMANTVMNLPDRPVDSFTAALWLLRMTATIPLFAILGGLLLRRLDARSITVLGLGLIAVGMFSLAAWEIEISEPQLTVDLVVAGSGFGLVVAPLMHRAVAAAPADYRAVAASTIVVARMLGMTLGLAVLSAWGINQMLAILIETPSPLTVPGLDADDPSPGVCRVPAVLADGQPRLVSTSFIGPPDSSPWPPSSPLFLCVPAPRNGRSGSNRSAATRRGSLRYRVRVAVPAEARSISLKPHRSYSVVAGDSLKAPTDRVHGGPSVGPRHGERA